jgi:3-dehydroquinate synthase
LYADELAGSGAKGALRILDGLEEFREHLGGKLTITLLKEIGRAVQVNEMSPKKVVAAIQELRQRSK